MGEHQPRLGPYPYGHAMEDVFLDPRHGTINYDYFRQYLDAASLPIDLAKWALGEFYSPYRGREKPGFIKFIRLSTLRKHERIPSFERVRDDLVDHTQVPGFSLSGPLSLWRGKDLFSKSPCVFVSHRWRSPDEPDPDGARLHELLDRLGSGDELYLWVDYCCLPQRVGAKALTDDDRAALQSGLVYLPEIVKSCDLLILDSPDYLGRVWCYTELFVWLTKVAEVSDNLHGRPLFESALTQRSAGPLRPAPQAHGELRSYDTFIRENLSFRGYAGTPDDLKDIFEPINDYCGGMIDSAGYTLGAGEQEFVPHLVRFMCNAWYLLQRKQCSVPDDARLCLRVIVDALKFANDAIGR
ncbi:MAG: hypothetical protein QM736_01870 [Vicinamibacterales bacterium]